jgi:hypothetical protein
VNTNIERTIVEVATWAYIVKELAKVDPLRDGSSECFVCDKYINIFLDDIISQHDKNCAWRQAKEFTEKS